MLSLATRKISGHCFGFVLAAVLLHGGDAFAAASVDDAQAQAAVLLTGASVSHTERALTSLPAADALAFPSEPQDQARWLLAGKPGLAGAEQRVDGRDSPSSAASAPSKQDKNMAYAGAQESARKMILGKDA